jgi:hypothetical protein
VIVGWVFERPGGGRSFGTTLGHPYSNFQIEAFRRMIVNGILWAAHVEVPAGGAPVNIGEKELALPPARKSRGEADRKPFSVLVQREKTVGDLIIGELSVNGQKIGPCYENAAKHVPAGTYKAHLRYQSGKNHVQGPGGKLGKKGDFLIELDDFTDRTGKKWSVVQFHAGNKAKHSEGCILGGPATKDAKTGDWSAPETLKKLRLLFYDGADNPTGTPDRTITVEVRDP